MATKKPKAVATRNEAADLGVSANERILKQIHELYVDGPNAGTPGSVGLKAVAEDSVLGLKCDVPRKKVLVMIIGNHSAGKSSFINWYIGEDVMKTGVAIETRGYSFVTSGKRRETLKGEATLMFFDHLEALGQFSGISGNLFTEVSTSREKHFAVVDFVDTPGLVDGNMKYPFDVGSSILAIAEHADLVLVFLDPIGQALCERTMDVVKRLNDGGHSEKCHYFLTKADQVEKTSDMQRVLIQITQNLVPNIKNSHAFNLPTIYLPRDDAPKPHVPNAIGELCGTINKTLEQSVQKNLSLLKDDCGRVRAAIHEAVKKDRAARAANLQAAASGAGIFVCSLVVAAALFLLLVFEAASASPAVAAVLKWAAGPLPPGARSALLSPLPRSHAVYSLERRWGSSYVFGALVACLFAAYVVSLIAARRMWAPVPVLSAADHRRLEGFTKYATTIEGVRKQLYSDYFKQIGHDA